MKKNGTKAIFCSRFLSLILSVAMILTMMPAMAFAGSEEGNTDDTTKLLVFGASTSSGYGHADFVDYCKGYSPNSNDIRYEETDDFGLSNPDGAWTVEAAKAEKSGKLSRYAYPWKLKEYIAIQKAAQEQGVDTDDVDLSKVDLSKVELNAMTLSGMRSDELHAFLDPDYYAKAYAVEAEKTKYTWTDEKGEHTSIGFLTDHMEDFISALRHTGAYETDDKSYLPGTSGYQQAHEYVTGQVADADVIVLDIANNNFGTYLCERIVSGFGLPGQIYATNYGNQKIGDIVVDDEPKCVKDAAELSKKTIETVMNTVTSNVSALSDPALQAILDAFSFCFVDCLTNFTAVVNEIRTLNPDAKIIVLGTFSTLNGINLVMGDTKIDMGQASSLIYNSLNTYLKALDPNCDEYYYADVYNANIETFMDQLYRAETLEDLTGKDGDKELSPGGEHLMESLYTSFRDDYMSGMIESMAKEAVVKPVYASRAYAVSAYGNSQPPFDELSDAEQQQLIAETWGALDESSQATVADDFWASLNDDDKAAFTETVWSGLSEDQQTYIIEKATAEADTAYKPAIMQLLFDAGKVTDVDMTKILAAMSGGMDTVAKELKDYIARGKEPSDATMQLIQIIERFLLYNCVGLHPSVAGCDSMYQSVKTAYDKAVSGGNTAYMDTKEEIRTQIAYVMMMIRSATSCDNIDKIVEKLAEIQKAIQESGYAEQFKNQFDNAVKETIKLITARTDEMAKQLQTAVETANRVMLQKISRDLEILDTYIKMIPEISSEVAGQIKALQNKIKEISNDFNKDLIGKIKEIKQRMDVLSGELSIAKAREEYVRITNELQELGAQLYSIGTAAANLPEYQDALNEYMDLSRESVSKIKEKAAAAEEEVAVLTARAIDSKFSTGVAFTGGKAKITLTLDTDVLADGYTLTLNGKEVKYTENNGKLTYTVNNAKVGGKYNFELKPYVLYDNGKETVKKFGKTTKATVVPKVTLKKAKLKKAKGGYTSVTVKWAKVKGADGYKISLKSSTGTSYVKVTGGDKISEKITGLDKGKYTIKVRAYKKVGGKTYYGKWSAAKKAKVK